MRLALVALLCWPGVLAAQSSVCASCHPAIWRTYSRTGMARSFYRPSVERVVEDYRAKNTFNHQASDMSFAMSERGGHFFQSQYQHGPGGLEINRVEREIDYVLGSGEHARTYLHRGAGGTLVQLPLAWYAEQGGYWAMAPGYDRADHQDARRAVTYDCMFCHNAYPEIPAAHAAPRSAPVYTSVPEGIDCQRCHGSGEKHMHLARGGGKTVDIAAAIFNPARRAGNDEVCMQCHLETTSSPLPASIVRYERGPFSYRPGEALSDFILHFDHARGKGYDDKFEITGSVYRLRQSQCFLKTDGALRCTTCHDPHNELHGEEAARHYASICRACHAENFARLVSAGKHTPADDCVGCHMPKRRTDDVVHVVMTDHLIQRRKPAGDLLAEKAERRQTDATAYRGAVEFYYPKVSRRESDALYFAIAQVSQNSNLKDGIGRLAAAVQKYRPERAEYYLQLADA
ncbi:MAG TPA: hypothetical protein VKG79_10755, partial [Bryobacteraceae bacterium]|nr:hypothetical protein [Bryobacteraceae bacterium]